MTTYLSPRFGSYTYPAGTLFRSLTDGVGAKLRMADPPSVDGQFTAGGLVAARKFSIRGTLALLSPSGVVSTDAAAFRTLRDAFVAAHAPGSPQAFWIDDDRYVNAEVESTALQEWTKGLPNVAFEIGFVAADPFAYQGSAYAPATNTVALAVAGASPSAANTSQVSTPSVAPTVAGAAAATALAAGTYEVAYTYRDAFGETQISPVGSATITAGQKIAVTALALPSGVASANIYVSIAAGSSTLAWVQTWDGTAANITTLPASPNSATVTPTGTVYSLPVITIVVTSAPSGALVYVVVTGAGLTWAFQFSPTGTGTYTIDATTQAESVTLAGVDVTSSVFFQGVFPRLAVSANTVVVGLSGGAAASSASCVFANRWLNP